MVLVGFGLVVTWIVRRQADPFEIAKQFFAQTGFAKIETTDHKFLRLQDRARPGLVALWEDDGTASPLPALTSAVQKEQDRHTEPITLYLVYHGAGPSSTLIHDLKSKIGGEVIPLSRSLLQRATWAGNCQEKLLEFEEPYVARHDPYSESKPIQDPTWFYGRDPLLTLLPPVLAQGQHVGIFGLRKVGKTSFVNQLRQRFVATPTVFIDYQAFSSSDALGYCQGILEQLYKEFSARHVKGLQALPPSPTLDSFRQTMTSWFEAWQQSGSRDPFLVIFDEIDTLFPDRSIHDSDRILSEYVTLFRMLRGLAQSSHCLVTLMIGYRAHVNRHNQLSSTVGENPMFRSFQEEHVGFLTEEDSQRMVQEIGLWREIRWDEEAASRVFYYCGGHPLLTRLFASSACDEGNRKHVSISQVETTADELTDTFRRNDLGNYFDEGIWSLLRDEEQEVLTLILRSGPSGLSEEHLPSKLEDDMTTLEHFGIIHSSKGAYMITGELFRRWIKRKVTA
jgi:hypothetical protein